jgi:hypothetical protein
MPAASRTPAKPTAAKQPALSEAEMLAAEQSIPELAARGGRSAYKQSLAMTGAVVVKTSSGTLVERRADGSSVLIKPLHPGKRVKRGLVLRRARTGGSSSEPGQAA